MRLPIKELDFCDALPTQEGQMRLESIPESSSLDSGEKKADGGVLQLETNPEVSFFSSMTAIQLENKSWSYCELSQRKKTVFAVQPFLCGTRYIEDQDGVHIRKKDGDLVQISNATIRLVEIQEEWLSDTKSKKKVVCQIYCEAWNGECRTLEVPLEEYKQVYQLLHKKYPDVLLAANGKEALEEYLTDVVANKLKTLPVSIRALWTGWIRIRGEARYLVGKDPFFDSYEIPAINPMDRENVFRSGTSFLSVGNDNLEINIIWIFSHISYSLFWLREGKTDFRSVLFVKGLTNNLKTSVVREISNVFDKNRDHAVIRIASTVASLQYQINMLRDQTIGLDDFSNSELRSKNKAVEAAEDVIRAIADGVFPTKMAMTSSDRVTRNAVRAGVIMTGEEELGLGLSSNYRTIVIPIKEGCFDGTALELFQENPNILREYFALYVQFLTENGEKLAAHCCEMFQMYRRYYSEKLQTRRLIDAAAGLNLITWFISQFALYCGVRVDEQSEECRAQCILELLQQNQKSSEVQKPEVRFLSGLMQSIGTGPKNGLARDEETYVLDESQFIGFLEKDEGLIWVRFESAWDLVVNYYRKQSEQWLTKPLTIKELLLKKDISVGKKAVDGNTGNEYVCKSKKEPRRRFLVLRKNMVEQVLNTEEDKNG